MELGYKMRRVKDVYGEVSEGTAWQILCIFKFAFVILC